jgi:hypothetical protein
MKRLLGLCGVFLVSIFLLYPRISYCAPKAFFQNTVYDAGEVPQGKEISNEFTLKNIGDQPLTFKVRPC